MNWILIIGAIVVAWLVFTGLLNILKTTVTTAITIAAIVLALQLLVGIGPQQLIDTILSLPRLVIEAIRK
ncbi:MAG: hypothetical protein ACOYME_04735 [Prochlorotrichaceae cyanobacterium]